MSGAVPGKGEGVRAEATAYARLCHEAGDMAVREIVIEMTKRYRIAEATAYQYQREARQDIGLEVVRDQLVIGMKATADAARVATELEKTARTMAAEADGVVSLDLVSKAFKRAGDQYLGVARAAIKLDVGEQMSDDDQREILVRAVVANAPQLDKRTRRELAASLLGADDEAIH